MPAGELAGQRHAPRRRARRARGYDRMGAGADLLGGERGRSMRSGPTPRRAATTRRVDRPRGTRPPPHRARGLDPLPIERRPRAGDAGDQLGPPARRSSVSAQGVLGIAPGHQLVARVAQGLPGREAPADVVARGGGHPADAQRARARPTASAFTSAPAVGSKASSAARPSCGAAVGTTRAGFSESSAARSAARITLGLFGRTRPPRRRRVHRPRAARRWTGSSSRRRPHQHAELLVEPPNARAAGHRHDRARPPSGAVARSAEARAALGDLLVHVGHVEARDLAGASKIATACSGSSVCRCTRRVRSSPTTSTESPIALEPAGRRSWPRARRRSRRSSCSSGSSTDSCSGRCSAAGAIWCSSSARRSPRSAARHPAKITVRP